MNDRRKLLDPTLYSVVQAEGTSNVPELYERAGDLLDAWDMAGARALYEEALAREPGNAQAYIGLGGCALQEQRFDLALQLYGRALELSPTSASANLGLGNVHQHQERYAEAVKHYLEAVRLDDTLADAHWGAASAFEAMHDLVAMHRHARRVLQLAPDSLMAPLARAMIKQAWWSSGRTLLRAWLFGRDSR
ncbi:MAG: tetratricopeptide repeat protein [Myxococcaceae bacterium]|nr:tetratricopeptide repeat protein [Myxococcaceae bacterium]